MAQPSRGAGRGGGVAQALQLPPGRERSLLFPGTVSKSGCAPPGVPASGGPLASRASGSGAEKPQSLHRPGVRSLAVRRQLPSPGPGSPRLLAWHRPESADEKEGARNLGNTGSAGPLRQPDEASLQGFVIEGNRAVLARTAFLEILGSAGLEEFFSGCWCCVLWGGVCSDPDEFPFK